MNATKTPPFVRDERLRALVAELRAAGLTYAAIADRLGISLTTTRLLTLPPPPAITIDPPKPTLCRCCRVKKPNRPRGLCWTCYYGPGSRDRFEPISKFANRGHGNDNRARRPLPQPTYAAPGSEEKIQTLAARADAGHELWHPLDAAC